MSLKRPGTESREDTAARINAREYGDLWQETKRLPLRAVAERILFDLDEAVNRVLPAKLRFAIIGRGDHLCVDVFGLSDNEINTRDGHYTDHANGIRTVVLAFVSAYNYVNRDYAWDVRFNLTVRLLSESEQWGLRNAPGAIDVHHYPYWH